MIKIKYIFPLILIILDLCAALVYFLLKDWKKGVYWIAAAVLTLMVTLE